MVALSRLVRDGLTSPPLCCPHGGPLGYRGDRNIVVWRGCQTEDGHVTALVNWGVLVSLPANRKWTDNLRPGHGPLKGLKRYMVRAILVSVWAPITECNAPLARVVWVPYRVDAPVKVPGHHDFVLLHKSCGSSDIPLDWIRGLSDVRKGTTSLTRQPTCSNVATVGYEVRMVQTTYVVDLVPATPLHLANPPLDRCYPAFSIPATVSDTKVVVPLPIGDITEGSGK